MDREEFLAKAEQLDEAGCNIAEQIEALAKQAEKQKHNWPSELAGCVDELRDCAREIEGSASRLPFIFKADDET